MADSHATISRSTTTTATTTRPLSYLDLAGASPAHQPSDNLRPPRTLVLCFDGRGDQFESLRTSNLRQFHSLLKRDAVEQKIFYQEFAPSAYGLPKRVVKEHIRRGYTFIMENYEAGDKVCLFGFSWGAYTARALSGMIRKVGLLPVGNSEQVPLAYKLFTRTDEIGWRNSKAFKETFAIDIDIEFLGVWDAVCAVGVPQALPFATSGAGVKKIRHALSLDERRTKFSAYYFDSSVKEQKMREDEVKFYHGKQHISDILEVWFAGCHSDVGGGAVDKEAPHSLARISLRWMIRQCFLAETGLRFDVDKLRFLGLGPNPALPRIKMPNKPAIDVLVNDPHTSARAEQEDLEDIKSAMHDESESALTSSSFQRFLFLRRSDYSRVPRHNVSLDSGRQIPSVDTAKIHWTVSVRMNATDPKEGPYVPQAKFDKNKITWVD